MTRRTAVLLALPLIAGCAWFGLGQPPDPGEVLKAADARLPNVAFTDIAEYSGIHLYDYMNGAAEAYYRRNFQLLGAGDAKEGDNEAKLEVYRVESDADAAALFDDHNDGKGKELPAGLASAAWHARELEGIFHRGPYFVRIIIYGNDKPAQRLLDTLAAAIDQAIPE